MATQKKSTKGDGAKPVTMWAVVHIGKRSECWVELEETYGKTWVVRKVTVSLA